MASVNTNIGAMVAQNNMSKQTREMEQAMERLSSGLRLNSAADDAQSEEASCSHCCIPHSFFPYTCMYV